MWYACVPAFALLMSYSYHAWAYVCSVSVYSEIWILIFFLFLLQKTRDLLVLSSTVSSTLSPPILSFYLTPFIFLLFLLCRSIVTPYTYSLSLSLSSRQRATQNTNPHSQFMTLFSLIFSIGLCCWSVLWHEMKLTHFVPFGLTLVVYFDSWYTMLHKPPCNITCNIILYPNIPTHIISHLNPHLSHSLYKHQQPYHFF